MPNPIAENRVNWRRVLVFYVSVIGVSYVTLGGFLAFGGSFQDPRWVIFAQVSSLTPAIMALVLTRLWHEPLRAHLGLYLRMTRWYFACWLVPLALSGIALLLGLAIPGVTYDGTLQPALDQAIFSTEQVSTLGKIADATSLPLHLLLLPLGLVASLTMSLLSGCGEEIGWRGLLHRELHPLGFWRCTLGTWFLWLVWHLPLISLGYAYPRHPWLGAAVMTIQLLVVSVNAAYLRERTGSSVAVGLFHGSQEAFGLLAVAVLAGGSDLVVGLGGLIWVGAQAILACALLGYDRFVAREPTVFTRRGPRNSEQ